MVLGKTYGEKTEVSGIFIIVDKESTLVANIAAATCYKVLATFTKMENERPKQILLVEKASMVTDNRLAKYRNLHAERGLPIVQIPLGDHVEVPANTLSGMFAGKSARQDFNADTMVLHGSQKHIEFEKDQSYKKGISDATHSCRTCGPGR